MFVQVVLVFSFWQGRIVVLNCDKGSDSMHDYRFGVGTYMIFELRQNDCGSFWLLVWPDWEVVKCFLQFFLAYASSSLDRVVDVCN